MSTADLTGTRPDVERVVVSLLDGEVAAEVSAAFNPDELPAVLIHRAGGGVAWPPVLDAGLVGLDVYAETKAEAWDLTAAVMEVLLETEGVFVGSPPFAWVSAIEDAGATIWLPDEATGRARYSAVVRVYCRGESASPAP